MNTDTFEGWLRQYGDAWREGDPDAVVRLFSADAVYAETPFTPPMRGVGDIRRYWIEGARDGQRDVTFGATPAFFDGKVGLAHWRATFRRVPSGAFVELDGMLRATFDERMRCVEFLEWWHRRESRERP